MISFNNFGHPVCTCDPARFKPLHPSVLLHSNATRCFSADADENPCPEGEELVQGDFAHLVCIPRQGATRESRSIFDPEIERCGHGCRYTRGKCVPSRDWGIRYWGRCKLLYPSTRFNPTEPGNFKLDEMELCNCNQRSQAKPE